MDDHKEALNELVKSFKNTTTKDGLMAVQTSALVAIYALMVEKYSGETPREN